VESWYLRLCLFVKRVFFLFLFSFESTRDVHTLIGMKKKKVVEKWSLDVGGQE